MDIPNMAVSDMGQILLYSVELESCTDTDQRRRQEVSSAGCRDNDGMGGGCWCGCSLGMIVAVACFICLLFAIAHPQDGDFMILSN